MIEHCIDYVKFKSETPFFGIEKTEKGIGNFKHKSTCRYGTVMWGHNKSDKFSHIISGKQYRAMVEDKSSNDISLLKDILEHGAELTRLDLAVTTDVLSVEDIRRIANDARGALPDQGILSINDERVGRIETLTCGKWEKRGTNGLFRAYRHDLKHNYVEKFAISRFELEVGSKRATQAARKVVINNQIGSVIDSYISFPMRGWYHVVGATELSEPKRGKTRSEQKEDKIVGVSNWLVGQCAKSLGCVMANEIYEYGKSATYERFMSLARAEFEREIKRIETGLGSYG